MCPPFLLAPPPTGLVFLYNGEKSDLGEHHDRARMVPPSVRNWSELISLKWTLFGSGAALDRPSSFAVCSLCLSSFSLVHFHPEAGRSLVHSVPEVKTPPGVGSECMNAETLVYNILPSAALDSVDTCFKTRRVSLYLSVLNTLCFSWS